MKDIDVQIDWRHFAKCMAIFFIALLGLSGMTLVHKFDGLQCFLLVMLSGLLSFILAVLVSGMHAIKRDLRNGRILLANLTLPVILLVSIASGMASLIYFIPLPCQRFVGYMEIALWLFVIGAGLRSWILKRRSRAQRYFVDIDRRSLRRSRYVIRNHEASK